MIEKPLGYITKLTASKGWIHKKGTETYAKSIMMLPTDSIDDYEEVDEIPAFTKSEYDRKVAELVRRRYSESEEFAIQRKRMNAITAASGESVAGSAGSELANSEYEEYNSYVERCKEEAKNPDLYKPEMA